MASTASNTSISNPPPSSLFKTPKFHSKFTLPIPLNPHKNIPNSYLEQLIRLVSKSKRQALYVGGGCLNSSEELKKFLELTGIPVATTLMGLGSYPCSDDLSLQRLIMHGTVYANYAVYKSDLLLAFGVRFDDRVTGRLEAFASRAKIVHIDIGSAEIGKNKQPHVSVCADVKQALEGLNVIMEGKRLCFMIPVENLPVMIILLNIQHLGMAVQWEDRFYKANRAHTYLRNPSKESEIYPNMLKFAEACGIPAARVTKKGDVRAAIRKMLDTPGPYLLDVIVPHQEHVLPMIPSGGAFKDVITEGDGRSAY